VLLHEIADYTVGERSSSLGGEVVHHAKRAVLDWFAATIPGGLLAPAAMLRKALAADIGQGAARLYPSWERTTSRTAALINGTASHIIEFDDIFRDAIYHPGSPVVAAALAVAQERRATGDAFARAVIVGYEISTRIGAVVNPAHYEYWHTTGTVGSLGAAAAAATVLELDRDEIAHALATAGTFAAGLQQAFRSDAMSKPLHAGRAAEAGVLAAMAAAEGVTGALDILDGARGFGNAMSERCEWAGAVEGLGKHYNITKLTVKNHACCGHTFPAIDGVLALRRDHQLTPESVKGIRVATYRTALDVTGSWTATTPFEAKFSLPYVVATALMYGSVRLDAFTETRLSDPTLKDLMGRIELEVDSEIDGQFPGRRAAHVTVATVDGEALTRHQSTSKGDPDDPLTDKELQDKYRELVEPVIGGEAAQALLEALWALDKLEVVDLPMGKVQTSPGGVIGQAR
jgi:2-methylcitrate dehydratase PrpD